MRISRAEQLKRFFKRNGYLMQPNLKKKHKPGDSYKKGYEIRLTALDYNEYLKIRRLLKEIGFNPGRSFTKGNRRIIPLYGEDSFNKFLNLMRKTKITSKI